MTRRTKNENISNSDQHRQTDAQTSRNSTKINNKNVNAHTHTFQHVEYSKLHIVRSAPNEFICCLDNSTLSANSQIG